MIGLEGSTCMDKDGHVFIQGEALGGLRVQVNFLMVPTNLVHIVVGPGRGKWNRKKKKHRKQKHTYISASLGAIPFFLNIEPNYRTGQIYRFKRTLDPVPLKQLSNSEKWGNRSVFITRPYRTVCIKGLSVDSCSVGCNTSSQLVRSRRFWHSSQR